MDIIEVSSDYRDFKYLSSLFSRDLIEKYNIGNKNYHNYTDTEVMDSILIGYKDGEPIACGGYRVCDCETIEIKSMYVKDCFRQKGYSSKLLHSLELRCLDFGYSSIVLVIGVNQHEAINFYLKKGFKIIKKLKYCEVNENNLCMIKKI